MTGLNKKSYSETGMLCFAISREVRSAGGDPGKPIETFL